MVRKILSILVCLICTLPTFALGKASFSKIWLEFDVVHGGEKCICVHSTVDVTGLEGKDMLFVAIVADDKGNWHQSPSGATVRTDVSANCTYASSHWSDLKIYLPYSRLYPKPGKHVYKVYVYGKYGSDWIGNSSYATYQQTGSSSSSGSSSSGSSSSGRSSSRSYSYSHSGSSNEDEYYTCGVCKGNGVITCLLCAGMGGSNQYRCMTVPPYRSYYVFVKCMACGGGGKVTCNWCGGKGQIKKIKPSTTGNYGGGYSGGNYNYGGSGSGSGSSGSGSGYKAYSKCRTCGGSGVCTSCGGRGGEWRSAGYYTGDATKTWIECPSCHGNKRCFNCYGTGRI